MFFSTLVIMMLFAEMVQDIFGISFILKMKVLMQWILKLDGNVFEITELFWSNKVDLLTPKISKS